MSSLSDRLPFSVDRQLIFAGATLFAAGLVARGFLSTQRKAHIIASPRKTVLPFLSDEEQSNLPYPPDAFPGARDIDSPFGSIRAYEFGPEAGRKVLLVHGISTPCLSLGAVAHGLAEKGCRVMLFDLFGRGYSDTPGDLQHDIRLFTTQILLVLASSPLSWTGASSGRFSMVGYSLGGGITAGFASYLPDLIDSLILIAPSGLLRPKHINRTSRMLYSEGVIPEPILLRLVRRRLKTPLAPPQKQTDKEERVGVTDAAAAEVNLESNAQVVLSNSHPKITIEGAVAHQLDNHEGFVQSFMSSIRHGPILDQHERWQRVGQQFSQRSKQEGLHGKILIICGDRDPIIVKDELQEDATAVLDGNVEFRFIDAGHEAPVTKGNEVVKFIIDFWG